MIIDYHYLKKNLISCKMNCDRFKCSLQRRHTVFVTTIELKLFGQMSNSSFLTAGEKTLGCQS